MSPVSEADQSTTAIKIRSVASTRLYLVIRAMAPESDWGWLQGVVRRLNRRAQPIQRKDSQLRHPRELIELGEQLMREADASGAMDLASAARFRNGLMIAFSFRRPSRGYQMMMMASDRAHRIES